VVYEYSMHLVETLLLRMLLFHLWNRQHGRDRIGAPNILPPPGMVVELDNAAKAHPASEITEKPIDDSASTEQVV
jgi:hypothetical protein